MSKFDELFKALRSRADAVVLIGLYHPNRLHNCSCRVETVGCPVLYADAIAVSILKGGDHVQVTEEEGRLADELSREGWDVFIAMPYNEGDADVSAWHTGHPACKARLLKRAARERAARVVMAFVGYLDY